MPLQKGIIIILHNIALRFTLCCLRAVRSCCQCVPVMNLPPPISACASTFPVGQPPSTVLSLRLSQSYEEAVSPASLCCFFLAARFWFFLAALPAAVQGWKWQMKHLKFQNIL